MDSSTKNRFERRKHDTRRKLKAAVIALILEKGYDAVSVQDITDYADLGRGTFYVHYRDKEDILWRIVSEGFAQFESEMLTNRADLTPQECEHQTWLLIFRYAEQNRDLYRVMLGGKGSALLTQRIQAYLAAVIEQQMQTQRFFETLHTPADYLAQFVTGALMRLVIWWLEAPNNYTPAQMAAMFHARIYAQQPK